MSSPPRPLDTSSSTIPEPSSPAASSCYSLHSSPSTNTTRSPGRVYFYSDYEGDEDYEAADDWYQPSEFWYPRIYELCGTLWPGTDHTQTKVVFIDESDYYKNFSILIASPSTPTTSYQHEEYTLRLPVLEDSLTGTVGILQHLVQLAEANGADIKLPKLVCHDTTKANDLRYPYMMLQRIPGVPMRDAWPELSQTQRVHVAREVGRLYVQLQRIRSDAAGSIHVDVVPECEHREARRKEKGESGEERENKQQQQQRQRKASDAGARVTVTAFGNAFWNDGASDVDWHVADNDLLPLRALRRDPPGASTATFLQLAFRRRLYQDRHQHRRGRRPTRKADDDVAMDAAAAGAGARGGSLVRNTGEMLYGPCLELIEDMHGASDIFGQLGQETDSIRNSDDGEGARPFHLWHTALHPGNIFIDRPGGPASDPVISAVLDWEEEQVLFTPPFAAAEPPRWLWAAGGGDDARLGQRNHDLNLEPLSGELIDAEVEEAAGVADPRREKEPHQQSIREMEGHDEETGVLGRLAVKRAFEAVVGPGWCRRAYTWELGLARRIFMLSLVYPYPVGYCYQLEDLAAAWAGRGARDEGSRSSSVQGEASDSTAAKDPEFARSVEYIIEGIANLE